MWNGPAEGRSRTPVETIPLYMEVDDQSRRNVAMDAGTLELAKTLDPKDQ